MNVLTSDVARDPSKLELRLESTTEGTSGPIIMRHYDLNDDEMQKQLERELYTEELSPEARFCERVTPSSLWKLFQRKRLFRSLHRNPRGRWDRCPN